MNDPIAIIRAVVRDELRALRLGDLAVVTSVFPHTRDSDTHNHYCNVKLREGDLELRKVPIATPHVGMVSTPAVGDLVLLSYVGGDANRAVIVGRLYSDQARPPLHQENEWRIEAPRHGQTSLAIDPQGALVLTTGKTVLTLHPDDRVEITGETDLKVTVKGNVTLNALGKIDLGLDGGGVITDMTHKCYFTGAPLVGSTTVKAKG
ncbi:MAG: phage baseplate assembly protein V [Candidatus Accumulibacter sp. UW27]|jgi:phage baseplate assembly protein gpV